MFNRILNNKNIFKLFLAQLMLILLSSCSQNSANKEIHDPLESMNRSVFKFNQGLDKYVFKPINTEYEKLPENVKKTQEISIERRIIITQEQDVYYISAEEPPDVVMGLAYDEGAKEEIGNPDLNKLNYQNYNELTGSFNHSDDSIIGEIISGSDVNLKIDYSKYGNHVHFGSAVAKLENFKLKAKKIENALMQVSKACISQTVNQTNFHILHSVTFCSFHGHLEGIWHATSETVHWPFVHISKTH